MTANYNEYTYALGYKDVYLVPNYSELESRSHADTTVKIKDFKFTLPIMPSNMKSVVDLKTYHLYDSLGLAPIMHRFDMDNVDVMLIYLYPIFINLLYLNKSISPSNTVTVIGQLLLKSSSDALEFTCSLISK